MPALNSTAIEHVDHDGEALLVTFRGGREYRYPSAGAEHVDGMAGAESAGRYFHEQIKPHYEHQAERRGNAASFIRTARVTLL